MAGRTIVDAGHRRVRVAAALGLWLLASASGARAREAPLPTGAGALAAVRSLVGGSASQLARLGRLLARTALPSFAGGGPAEAPELREARAAFARTQHGRFDPTISAAAARWALDPFVLKGLLENESGLDPDLVGKIRYGVVDGRRRVVSGGARGIAQLTTSGIRGVNHLRRRRRARGEQVAMLRPGDVFVPERAVPAAAELLAEFIRRYGLDGGITAYNSGEAGGRAVLRYGFWRARSQGRLSRAGVVLTQGHRFLLNVLRQTNRLRVGAGLAPLPPPASGPARGPRASS